jgi:hypothetical protein
VTAPLTADAFEAALGTYLYERAEEARAVRVGEKETSEQAAVVARHRHLFTRTQLSTLVEEEERGSGDGRERLARLRLVCEDGIVTRELAAEDDALENALLAARLVWEGEELPLRSAQARLAVEPGYVVRSALGEAVAELSAGFNERRLALLQAREALEAEISATTDPVARSEAAKGIELGLVLEAVDGAREATTASFDVLRGRWLPVLLGEEADAVPPSSHLAWIRRLSPLAATYTKERCVPVCEATLRAIGFDLSAEPGIRPDLDDRPQKSPRACVIASDPPRVVHLITRALGGVHDYEAFLHEAGHALHYAGLDPDLPLTFRRLARDHALTEIYSFLLDSIAREPGWHAEHFGLDDAEATANAEATVFVEALMFRRYSAKLGYELDFWRRFPADGGTAAGYSERLTAATRMRYPDSQFVTDMDAGFYSADYLRAWIRAAQVRAHLRREVGDQWWRSEGTGAFLRALFREGTRPSTEDVAAQIGFAPLDADQLVAELTV